MMTITFAELYLGFVLLKIPMPLLLAFLVAVVDILPVLGTRNGPDSVGAYSLHYREDRTWSGDFCSVCDYHYSQTDSGTEGDRTAGGASSDCHPAVCVFLRGRS